MNKKLRKTIRLTAISLGALLTVFLLAVTIVVNFIFTPEKLTPVVLNVANQSLNARLQMKSVELTFFSTFPQFGLKVTDGVLVSKAINDTLWQKTDSLVSFKKCVVVVNPVDYLLHDKISLRYLGLEDASVYAFKNKEGKKQLGHRKEYGRDGRRGYHISEVSDSGNRHKPCGLEAYERDVRRQGYKSIRPCAEPEHESESFLEERLFHVGTGV